MTSTDGLLVFVLVVVLNVAGLAIDFALGRLGVPQITDLARSYPLLALLILSVQVAGLAGLVYHFLNGKR